MNQFSGPQLTTVSGILVFRDLVFVFIVTPVIVENIALKQVSIREVMYQPVVLALSYSLLLHVDRWYGLMT